MIHRIEVTHKIADTRAKIRKKEIEAIGFSGKIDDLGLIDVYTIEGDFQKDDLDKIKSMLTNPVFQETDVDVSSNREFSYSVEIGFLPGVTDNIGDTAREGVLDLLGRHFDGVNIYSSQLMLLSGKLTREDVRIIGESLANPLIQRIYVRNREELLDNKNRLIVPKVRISKKPKITLVDIINADDEELIVIGKQGILN